MTAQVYTDGSCLQGQAADGRVYRQGYGGWAAVCEHGSDGWVVRGRTADTSNVRMEVVAVVQGLRSLPAGTPARVYTDATLLLVIYDWWCRSTAAQRRKHPHPPRHYGLWLEVAAELDSRTVAFELVRKGCDRQVYWAHRRAHVFAQYEARAARHDAERNGQPPQEPSLKTLNNFMPAVVRKLRQQDSSSRNVLPHLQGRPVAADPLATSKPRWSGVRNRGGRRQGP